MAWLLSSIVGASKPSFPFNVGEAYTDSWGAWTHCRGTTKDDPPAEVSVFKLSAASASDPKLVAARNGVKRLRTLRHPHLLQFKDSAELEADKGITLFLVTEPVQPLSSLLQELRLEGAQRDDYIALGLSQVAQAVAFLNADCKMIHGNVCLASVVVTETLDWRLHAFDLMSEWSAERPPEALMNHAFMIADQYKPEEMRKGAWDVLREAPPWAVDAWGVGCLIQEIFSAHKMARTEELRDLSRIPLALQKHYQRLLGSVPTRRLNPAALLESTFFQNKLVDTISFLEKLNIKDGADKDQFFRRLGATLDQLPAAVVQRKVLPLIASGLEFGSAPSAALASLLHVARGLPPAQLAARIVPCVIRLYASPDRATRVALLQHLDAYVEHISSEQMEAVYEHLQNGFNDGTAYLRELTLKSLLKIVPKLSQRTLTSSLLKHLAKLQVDEEPAIRANTTICLGNIAHFLGAAACKRVLLNAFTRALRDPFPPARAAGLMALQATLVHYDASEGALRVLPCVVPLTVDADAAVRSAAFETSDAFLGLLRKHHQSRAGEATSADAAAAASRPLLSAADAPAAAAAASGGGLLGWAVGGMGALAAAVGAPPSLTPEKVKPSPPPARKSSAATAAAARGGAAPSSPAAAAAVPARGGWDGEDEEFGVDQEEAAARARLGGGARGAAGASTSASGAKPPSGDTWEVDDDEPLEDLQAPPPMPVRPAVPAASRGVPGGRPAGAPALAARPAGMPAAKPMKLGASKLGASKLKGGDLDLEALLAD